MPVAVEGGGGHSPVAGRELFLRSTSLYAVSSLKLHQVYTSPHLVGKDCAIDPRLAVGTGEFQDSKGYSSVSLSFPRASGAAHKHESSSTCSEVHSYCHLQDLYPKFTAA